MLCLIWFAVVVVVLWMFLGQPYFRFSRYGVKGPTPVPLLGAMAQIILRQKHLTEANDSIYRGFAEDRFVGVYEFVSPVVVIRDLELIKKVLVKDCEHFVNHRAIIDDTVEPFFGKSVFFLKGQKWKDMRATLSPAFTSSKIRLMVPFMVDTGEQMVKSLKKIISENGGCMNMDVKEIGMRYANDVIATCVFGIKVDSYTDPDNQFYEMGKATSNFKFNQVLKFFGYAAFPKIMKLLRISLFEHSTNNFFKTLVMSTMEDRKTGNIIRPDMIHLLMEAKKGKLTHEDKSPQEDTGFATVEESDLGKRHIIRQWSDEDLIAQAAVFFVAGFEPISTTMAFLLFELALNPDVQEKLAREIRESHERNKGKLDYNTIPHLKYLDMVVSELLRLWTPAIMVDRMCTKDYNLGRANEDAPQDYVIRKGEGVMIPVWSIHRDPQYFPDPLRFDPERFSDDNKHNIKPFSYMPFGLGPRNCIASRFALCEVKVMTYQLLLHMKVEPCEKSRLPIELSKSSFNPRIEGGHWLRVKARN